MLFGESTSALEAERLLDLAVEAGITFFDTAEMYPVPQSAATQVHPLLHSQTHQDRVTQHFHARCGPQGRSEKILGAWLRRQRHRPRSQLVVATKVAGPGGMDWLRGGPLRVDAANIAAALDASLARLGLDYVDLLQLHWPDRQACCLVSCRKPRVAAALNAEPPLHPVPLPAAPHSASLPLNSSTTPPAVHLL